MTLETLETLETPDILDIEHPHIKPDEVDDRHGRFSIEPLDRGYGTTLGNAMRRVLMSSLQGAAVTHIMRLEGVLHEFSTIPGVVEDTTEIVLNLKQLNLRLHTDKPKILKLDVKGERVVTAENIQEDPEVEILNPELHIATLTEKSARLSMELRVEKGRGYVPADRHRLAEQVIGVIPVDSIFSPIVKCNYVVEDTRVGQVTNYDKLILDLLTDGSITPTDAVSQAAQILQHHLAVFTSLKVGAGDGAISVPEGQSILSLPIEEMGLSVRSLNCLKRAQIHTLGEIVQYTEEDMMKLKNFGQKSLDEIKDKLIQYGMPLRTLNLEG